MDVGVDDADLPIVARKLGAKGAAAGVCTEWRPRAQVLLVNNRDMRAKSDKCNKSNKGNKSKGKNCQKCQKVQEGQTRKRFMSAAAMR